MKKLGGCSVKPISAAKFDWSAGIFAKTVTQSELAANAAAKQVNCQNLMPPAPWICFLLQGSAGLASFFVAQSAPVNYLSSMWHFCHNSEARLVRELSEEAMALGKHRPKSARPSEHPMPWNAS